MDEAWHNANQGTDWQSQFNVQHVEGNARKKSLALSDSLIDAERELLRSAGQWEAVSLPHTAYVEPYVIVHPWQGVCYYKRTLSLPRQLKGKQIWIEFEGAMQLADIWLNGRHVKQHAGGYTTFLVDITADAHPGDNELLVRLDNRDNPLIPPGKPLGQLDFCYFSGLYRDVNLIIKDDIYLTHPLLANRTAGGGLLVTYPAVTEQEALVNIQSDIANSLDEAAGIIVRHTIYDWQRGKGKGKKVVAAQHALKLVAQGTGRDVQTLKVNRPRLWSPDAPELYLLRTEILCNGKVKDVAETRIGIRRFEITREGCKINGKPYYLDGANRHQEYPYSGYALSDNAHYRDIWQTKQNGFNTIRLGHYPQDPAVLDACDELGVLAIEPIPGWQFFNKDSIFTALTYENIRELIRRDRNHPSVIMWETTLNESWPPEWWKDEAVRTAHEELPGTQCFTSGDSYGYSGFDVCYNDWSDATFSRPNNSTKPAFIREYYDYEFGGHYSTSRVTRGDGEHALRQNLWNAWWSHNSNRARSNNTVGGAVWSLYDYNRGCCDNICYSGVADLFRLPKYSLHYYRLQQKPGSFTPEGKMPCELFIASCWDAQSSDTVVVLGNVSEVALTVNGKEVARQKAVKGKTTPYQPQTDGGNSESLDFPPFTFTGIAFQPGTIEAIGYDASGKRVAHTAVRTPGTPSALQLTYFESGRPAAQRDLLIIYVTLTDANGTPCHDNGRTVTLTATGGTIEGPATTQTEDGIASFIVRTSDAKTLNLHAVSNGLEASRKIKLQ